MTRIKPDLSFTEDPAWQAAREKQWKVIENSLKSDFRRKKLVCLKRAFFTGETEDPLAGETEAFVLGRSGSLLSYYPLQTAEGWDYALQHPSAKKEAFEDYVYYSVNGGLDNFRLDIETCLRFFDYFHPETYQPVLTSRVRLGWDGDYVHVKLNLLLICQKMLGAFSMFIDDKYESVVRYRQNYFFSALAHVGDISGAEWNSPEDTIAFFVRDFSDKYIHLSDYGDLEDPYSAASILTNFKNFVYSDQAHPSFKRLWEEGVKNDE